MQTMQDIFTRQKRALFFLLAFLLLGWAFTGAKEIFAGLMLGLVFGLYNFWILNRRMIQFDKKMDQGKRMSGDGVELTLDPQLLRRVGSAPPLDISLCSYRVVVCEVFP